MNNTNPRPDLSHATNEVLLRFFELIARDGYDLLDWLGSIAVEVEIRDGVPHLRFSAESGSSDLFAGPIAVTVAYLEGRQRELAREHASREAIVVPTAE